MRQAPKGQGSPAGLRPNSQRNQVLERELAELERRKMLDLRSGTYTLNAEGYRQLVRRNRALFRGRS